MVSLLSDLPLYTAERAPDATALRFRGSEHSYGRLADTIERTASGLVNLGMARQDRVAVYLNKRPETVVAFFATSRAGGVFVPVNPLLKPAQVSHILEDSGAIALITSADRLRDLDDTIAGLPNLRHVVVVDDSPDARPQSKGIALTRWSDLQRGDRCSLHRVIDTDIASILYTSGSTGRPKGVVLSHKNMVAGARSVAEYLENAPEDRLLAVLPFSFDYGFSQLSTAFLVGASVSLLDHLFARDVVTAVARDRITGLAAVPPLWLQLADLDWPADATQHLRYITNSGGRMPRATLEKLRAALPLTRPYLMYGLTEAFRGTYLPPEEIDRRPDSIGMAIPGAEILVVRPDGTPCAPHEPGELVQRGSLVAQGYWNDRERTAQRFRPAPGQLKELPLTELAVWSGDTVKKDEDGYLYFVGRRDEMIKTSGYRVSPTEVEEIIYASGLVSDVVALASAHTALGEGIVVVASPPSEVSPDDTAGSADAALLAYCRAKMPTYMVPQHIAWMPELPRNPNGKFDRPSLTQRFKNVFEGMT
jgi:acyl-CoA ligase (AMP-forming) (exosortase A-associated)